MKHVSAYAICVLDLYDNAFKTSDSLTAWFMIPKNFILLTDVYSIGCASWIIKNIDCSSMLFLLRLMYLCSEFKV